MARIVACPQCGAPHRTVGMQTQITCDYCRSLVVIARDITTHELVAPVSPDQQLAHETASRWLQNEGVVAARIVTGGARFCPVWSVSSAGGEEHHLVARQDAPALLHHLNLPAMRLVARSAEEARDFEPLPEPTVSREEAEQAALGGFREADPVVETVRLLWLPIVELTAFTPAGPVDGVYVAGAERLLFAPFPVGATDPPADRARLLVFASFLLGAWIVGAIVASPWSRVWIEAAIAAVMLGALYFGGHLTNRRSP